MMLTCAAICATFSLATSLALAEPATLKIDAAKPGVAISPSLYGIFFEEINYAGDGGLYPEMLRNRNFEDNATQPEFWSLVLSEGAKGSATLKKNESPSEFNQHRLSLTADEGSAGTVGVANDGYWGISIQKNAIYRVYLRASSADVSKLNLSLQNRAGVVYANAILNPTTSARGTYQTWQIELTANATDPSARLVLSIDEPGTVDIDFVSLKPSGEIANGVVAPKPGAGPLKYRPDLFEKLTALKPAFMRFPGGCWVEGETMATASRWKRTVGLPFERWTQPNLWGYHSTNGLGYHEYLQMCEDLGADAMFVINVGMSHRENVPMDQMGEYVQDALDAIEYAIGPVDSKYGKMRADAGHPEPFKLKYLQIGNENGGKAYDERYTLFFDAIKAKYPQMNTIACDWWNGKPTSRPIEILDEHYYNTPQFFFLNANKYDDYDRKGSKIYVGEYAVTLNNGAGSLIGALGEAAFMTGMERNSDIVIMASYAPLFTHVSGKRWNPDLINFDSSRSYGTPSYHVQTLFAQHRGDVVLPAELKVDVSNEPVELKGAAGVGTWNTQAEFKEFKVTGADGKTLYTSALANLDDWKLNEPRTFTARDGVLSQTSTRENVRATVGDVAWADYTVEVKAKKIAGEEGFLVLAHADENGNYVWFNVGGWGNTRTAIERQSERGKEMIGDASDFKVEVGRWYDLKLEVRGNEIKGYVDGKLLCTAKDERKPIPTLFATASRDQTNGDVIVKIVNGGAKEQSIDLQLAGLTNIESAATAYVMSGQPTDENTLDAPMKVAPKQITLNEIDEAFTYAAPAYSVTVLRVKAK